MGYFGVNIELNYTDADEYCLSTFGTHLATIKSSSDNTNVRTAATNASISTSEKIWIGFNDIDNEDTFVWIDGTTDNDYTNWYGSQPDNDNGVQDCTQMLSWDTWDDSYCSATRKFVCNSYPKTAKGIYMNIDCSDCIEKCIFSILCQFFNPFFFRSSLFFFLFKVKIENYITSALNLQKKKTKKSKRKRKIENSNNRDKLQVFCFVFALFCELDNNKNNIYKSNTMVNDIIIELGYYGVNITMTFADANAYCISTYNSHLATITSASDNRNGLIAAIIAGIAPDNTFWIGFNDIENEGTFSWIDSTTDNNYTNWNDGEPNNSGNNQDCVIMTSTGLWNDHICANASRFVCSFEGMFLSCCFVLVCCFAMWLLFIYICVKILFAICPQHIY